MIKWQIGDHGFTVINLPETLLHSLTDYVFNRIRVLVNSDKSRTVEDCVSEFSDDGFEVAFDKTERFFSAELASVMESQVLNFLPVEFKSKGLGMSLISPKELAANPSQLTYSSRDFFWRCVRLGKADVGKPHADFQFWELAKGTDAEPFPSIPYTRRWKVWIPLYGCNRENSLQMLPFSHSESLRVFKRLRGPKGITRPCIDEDYIQSKDALFICPITDFARQALLFHDRMIHRAPLNTVSGVRISAEFTLLEVG